ncbi:hypothetical protein BHE74_00004403 [Ensete ventricosum]|nr:hypothetical protein BHE74_00004403 [Ensete ventricosum]
MASVEDGARGPSWRRGITAVGFGGRARVLLTGEIMERRGGRRTEELFFGRGEEGIRTRHTGHRRWRTRLRNYPQKKG